MAIGNSITIVGFLGSKIQLKSNSQGNISVKMPIYTEHLCNVSKAKYSEVHWCLMFGKLAEKAERELKKDQLVHVTGAMHYHRYHDDRGKSQTLGQILVEDFNVIGKTSNAKDVSNV